MNQSLLQTVNGVRRQVRFALASETAARALVAAGGFFWLWLLVDWSTEPSGTVRIVAYLLAGGALLVWLLRHSLSALLTRLPDSVIAAWIERRMPELGDSLLTALSHETAERDGSHDTLLQVTQQRATTLLAGRGRPDVVDTRKLRPWFVAAASLLLSVLALTLIYPNAAGVYFRRLALSDEPWPRRVLLSVENFQRDEQGRLVRRVARDAPFELDVHAAMTDGHSAPDEVRASLRFADGTRSRVPLASVGEPTDGEHAGQAFGMKLDRLRQDLMIRLRGGDGRLGPLYVKVVPRPAITSVELEVRPPEYLQARTVRQPADAVGEVPEGAAVVVHAECNKPLARVAATLIRADTAEALPASLGPDGRRLAIELPTLQEGGMVELSLLDADGISGEKPFRLPLRVAEDRPPRVEFSLVGIGRVVTPEAVIPTSMRVEDDHAIGQAQLLLVIEGETHAFPIDMPATATAERSATPAIDLLSLRSDPAFRLARLEPGQRLRLQGTATDRYDLDGTPHSTASQTETLTIVTADELVARLEEREMNLRQTFEQVFDEARGVQLSADRLDDAPENAKPEDLARRRRLAMARLVERLGKVADETNGVARSFQAIHQELTNNRVPNDDLKDRIQQRIVRPLERIIADQMPVVQAETQAAADRLADTGATQSQTLPAPTREKLDRLVRDMELALKEMKAVETYNEVLTLLRGIIDEQRNLSRKTGDARKSSLKNLLLD